MMQDPAMAHPPRMVELVSHDNEGLSKGHLSYLPLCKVRVRVDARDFLPPSKRASSHITTLQLEINCFKDSHLSARDSRVEASKCKYLC